MSNEIQQAIDAELPADTAPVSLDVETVMRASRRARQRRVGYGASGALVSVIVAVAMVLTLTPLGAGSQESPHDGAAGQDEHSLDVDDPVVDPDKEYFWEGGASTEEYPTYTKAFWEHFSDRYPDATLLADDAQGSIEPYPGDPEERVFFLARSQALYEGNERDDIPDRDGLEPVQQRTTLGVYERISDGEGSEGTSCCSFTVQFDGDDGPIDRMEMEVYPAGSYTKRTGDIMDPAYCREDDTCDINDVTGPGGVDMQYVTVNKQADNDVWRTDMRYALLYREDGSAVRVAVAASTEPSPEVSDTLEFEDLRDIALALPDDKVE